MMKWENFVDEPTKESLQSYPTFLDILTEVVELVEKNGRMDSPLDNSIISGMFRKGRYQLIRDEATGWAVPLPMSRTFNMYFRAQSKYYGSCLPSLFRCSEETMQIERLRSCLQTAEMIHIMKSHPVIRMIECSPVIVEGFGEIHLPIIYDALAQHYGIKTLYLDFTSDIWTASFFACTSYDGEHYQPVIVNDYSPLEELYGVLYYFAFDEGEYTDPQKFGLTPIGMQFFNRPGRQYGYVRAMNDVRDLHLVPGLKKVFFRHDNEASRLIFAMSQFEKLYMPEDSFAEVVKDICKKDKFWRGSVDLARNIYYSDVDPDTFVEIVKKSGFEVTNGLNSSFRQDLVKNEFTEWFEKGGKERFLASIDLIPLHSF